MVSMVWRRTSRCRSPWRRPITRVTQTAGQTWLYQIRQRDQARNATRPTTLPPLLPPGKDHVDEQGHDQHDGDDAEPNVLLEEPVRPTGPHASPWGLGDYPSLTDLGRCCRRADVLIAFDGDHRPERDERSSVVGRAGDQKAGQVVEKPPRAAGRPPPAIHLPLRGTWKKCQEGAEQGATRGDGRLPREEKETGRGDGRPWRILPPLRDRIAA